MPCSKLKYLFFSLTSNLRGPWKLQSVTARISGTSPWRLLHCNTTRSSGVHGCAPVCVCGSLQSDNNDSKREIYVRCFVSAGRKMIKIVSAIIWSCFAETRFSLFFPLLLSLYWTQAHKQGVPLNLCKSLNHPANVPPLPQRRDVNVPKAPWKDVVWSGLHPGNLPVCSPSKAIY